MNSKLNDNDNGTTASFLIKKERFSEYVVCRLLKKYLLRASVKYVSLLGVEENVNGVVYYIFDQQRNVIRAAHKNYFMKQVSKGKVLSGQGVVVLLINRVVEAEVQGLFSIFSDVKALMGLVESFTATKDKVVSFASKFGKDILALILDVSSTIIRMFSQDRIVFSSLTTFIFDIVSICMRISSLKDNLSLQLDFSLDSLAWMLAGFGLPAAIMKRIKFFTELTGKRVLDSSGATTTLFEAVELVMDVLKWLSEKYDVYGVLTFLYGFLSSRFSFITNFRLMKEVSDLHFRWAKNSQVMLEPEFRAQVLSVHERVLKEQTFLDFLTDERRRINKVVYDSFKNNIVRFVKSYDSSIRLEPACIIFEGGPGCGKSVLMGNLTQILSSETVNLSVYSHIIPDINASKDFYDDYEGQDVMVVDDIGQQGVSQWRTIINMVSSIKMGLDCAAADKKNTKFFTSRLILGTTNNCSSIQGLSKTDGIADIGALFRRIHNVRQTVNWVNGQREFRLEYWKYDEGNKSWIQDFMPKWKPTALKMNLPSFIQTTDYHDVLKWVLQITEMAMRVNEDTMDLTGLSTDDVVKLGKCFSLQAGSAVCNLSTESVRLDIKREETWREICNEYFLYVKEWLLGSVKKFTNILARMFSKSDNSSATMQSIWRDEFPDEVILQCAGCEKGAMGTVICLLSLVVIGGLTAVLYNPIKNWLCESDRKKLIKSFERVNLQGDDMTGLPTRLADTPKYVRYMEIRRTVGDNVSVARGHCIVSGKRILTNCHFYGEDITVSLSRNWDTVLKDVFEVEHMPVKVVHFCTQFDWMVLEIQGTNFPFYPLAKSLFVNCEAATHSSQSHFITPEKVVPLTTDAAFRKSVDNAVISIKMPSSKEDFKASSEWPVRTILAKDLVFYGISASGLCGCPIVNGRGDLIGMHFAGTQELGLGMIFGTNELVQLRKFLLDGQEPTRIFYKDLEEGSAGMRLDSTGLKSSVPLMKTSLGPTGIDKEIFGNELYEVGEKIPPVFVDEEGKSVIKKMAMKSFGRTTEVSADALAFAEKVIDSMLPEEIVDLSLEDTVFGDGILQPLNKKSVNGYGYESQDKQFYFDYENRTVKDNFKRIFSEFKQECESGDVAIESILAKEALKDETRPTEKAKKPRSFRVMPLHHIVATKMCLGNLMKHIVEQRWTNGICIGFNPYADFDRLYDELRSLKCFDGDFGNWDGGCNPLIQDMINRVVFNRYRGENGEMLKVVMNSLVRTPVLVKEELFVTTHSMPSGAWVTALFNSLINRALTAICYYENCVIQKRKPQVLECLTIRDFVIGDDKLVGVPRNLENIVNAYTMKDLAESLNMRYTDGTKGEITSAFKPLKECVFVKRNFRFHKEMGKIVGALSLQTLFNTMLWKDDTKDEREVMDGKFTILQFESFLHERTDLVAKVKKEYERLHLRFREFSPSLIVKTMSEDPEIWKYFVEVTDKNY